MACLFIVLSCRGQDAPSIYEAKCADCHGSVFEGTGQGPALAGGPLLHGESVEQISARIAQGYPGRGMPAFAPTLSEAQIRGLALFISGPGAAFP